MTYDPNNPNDPNRTTTPNPDLDLRTTPVDHTRSSAWIGWAAAIAAIAVIAVAYTLWSGAPDTDPQPTASTTNSSRPLIRQSRWRRLITTRRRHRRPRRPLPRSSSIGR